MILDLFRTMYWPLTFIWWSIGKIYAGVASTPAGQFLICVSMMILGSHFKTYAPYLLDTCLLILLVLWDGLVKIFLIFSLAAPGRSHALAMEHERFLLMVVVGVIAIVGLLSGMVVIYLFLYFYRKIQVLVVEPDRFVFERYMEGSPYLNGPPPNVQAEVWVRISGKWYMSGQCFRVGDKLITVSHVIVDCELVKIKRNDVELELDPVVFEELDGDLVFTRLSNVELSRLALVSAKFAHTSVAGGRSAFAHVYGFGKSSIGLVEELPIFGFCKYTGSTDKGFSGAPYLVNKTVFGVHVGSQQCNMGYEGAFVKSLLAARDESTEDWLMDQLEKKDKWETQQSPYNPDEWRVKINGRYITVGEDPNEMLEKRRGYREGVRDSKTGKYRQRTEKEYNAYMEQQHPNTGNFDESGWYRTDEDEGGNYRGRRRAKAENDEAAENTRKMRAFANQLRERNRQSEYESARPDPDSSEEASGENSDTASEASSIVEEPVQKPVLARVNPEYNDAQKPSKNGSRASGASVCPEPKVVTRPIWKVQVEDPTKKTSAITRKTVSFVTENHTSTLAPRKSHSNCILEDEKKPGNKTQAKKTRKVLLDMLLKSSQIGDAGITTPMLTTSSTEILKLLSKTLTSPQAQGIAPSPRTDPQ